MAGKKKIKPEVIAVIAAAVRQMCKDGRIVAVRVQRNENWSLNAKIGRKS